MSNYVKSTDFAAKDALVTGNPLKLIKGTEINDEFNNIQTAIATKADLSSPALSGNPTCATQAIGNNSTRLANTAFVQQELADAQAAADITGGTIDGVAITGGTVTGLATDLAVADGGTGASTLTANAVLLGNGTSAVQTVAPTTAGNVLRTNGTTWQSDDNLLAASAQNSTSGTSVNFTSIPSWVKRIAVMFSGVSSNGTSPFLIQLGNSGGIENTGYVSAFNYSSSAVGSTIGFVVAYIVSSSNTTHGSITIKKLTSNTWVSSGNLCDNADRVSASAGSKTLSAPLDRIRITTVNGTDVFDAGTINIIYE